MDKHATLLKRFRELEGQLESMKTKELEKRKDKPKATVGEKVSRYANNTMVTVARFLERSNPAYKRLSKQLSDVENKLDDESARLSRQQQ